MYTIRDDIKSGKLKDVYLLYGVEHYLVTQYRDNLLQAFCGSRKKAELEDDMNFTCFKGKDFTVEQVIELGDTLPFFAEKRVILIENGELFGKDGDRLAEYLPKKPETTVFIFVENNADGRSRLYKAVQKMGHAAEFRVMDEEKLKRWVTNVVTTEGKKITVRAVEALIEQCSSDMEMMSREMEKLFCYTGERDIIDLPDLDAVCTVRVNNHIFAMIEAMANKKQQEALRLYGELLALREAPQRILYLLSRHFLQLLTVKDLRNRGYDRKRISEKLDMKPFIVDKYMTQAGKFSMGTLKRAIEDCANFDEAYKSGKMNDRMCVELLLVKYSEGEKE
ncbi:MAG: DNA polymerase III subunit delta [Lachnospiraceae bacterium]|nr:DNA polymerase III subunit delta [Lachnospiraceae bacterium]